MSMDLSISRPGICPNVRIGYSESRCTGSCYGPNHEWDIKHDINCHFTFVVEWNHTEPGKKLEAVNLLIEAFFAKHRDKKISESESKVYDKLYDEQRLASKELTAYRDIEFKKVDDYLFFLKTSNPCQASLSS